MHPRDLADLMKFADQLTLVPIPGERRPFNEASINEQLAKQADELAAERARWAMVLSGARRR